jgi:hypothetical protein
LLASQQEQLKLARKACQRDQQGRGREVEACEWRRTRDESRITVELANKPAETAAASSPEDKLADDKVADDKPAEDKSADDKPEETKVATVEEDKGPAPEPSKSEAATLPEGITRDELATDIVTRLSELQCYQGPITKTWGEKPQDALQRFNDLAKLDLPLDEPSPETLAALKDWKGEHCEIRASVPKGKPPVAHVTPKAPTPKYKAKAPYKKPYRNKSASSPPPSHHDSDGDEQRELQRAFPSTNWPGQR